MCFIRFFLLFPLIFSFQLNCMRSAVLPAFQSTMLHSSRPLQLHAGKRFLHFNHLKGLYTGLTDEAKPYSPVHAAALAESGWVKRLYEVGNKEDATVKLLNDEKTGLFFLRDNQFRPTQNKSNPCYSLNPPLIGTMIGGLVTEKLNDQKFKSEVLKAWREEHKKMTGEVGSVSKMSAIIDRVYGSSLESKDPESLYLPHTTESLLLAHLYRKTSDKSQMVSYLQTLNKYVPTFDVLINCDQLVNEHYTSEEKQKYSETISSNWPDQELLNKYLDTDYEQTVYRAIKNRFKKPPQVTQGSYAYGPSTVKRPDCFETSMRDIFNHLLINNRNNRDTTFDLSMLPQGLNVRPEFVKFYTDYAGFDTVNNMKNSAIVSAGQAWMNIVSHIPRIDYRYGNYEISSSIKNMIHLFNNLLNCNVTTLEELGAVLSDNRRTVTFKAVRDSITYDNDNEITIIIKEKYQVEQIILNIRPGHTWLSDQKRENKTSDSFTNILLGNNSAHTISKTMASNVPYLAALQPSVGHFDLTIPIDLTIPNNIIYHYALSVPLENPNEILTLISELLYCRTNSGHQKSARFLDLALNLLDKLPHDDSHYTIRAIMVIVHNKTHLRDQRFAEYMKKRSGSTINGIFSCAFEGWGDPVVQLELIRLWPQQFIGFIENVKRKKTDLYQYWVEFLIKHIGFGYDSFLDTFLFKELLPLRENRIVSLSEQEQRALLVKMFPELCKGLKDKETIKIAEFLDVKRPNAYRIPTNFLEYTFYANCLLEFTELLEAGADPDEVFDVILQNDKLPRAHDFLKAVLKFKPVTRFALSSKHYSEETLRLCSEAECMIATRN